MSTTNDNPDQLRADIEATREELGDTVEALAAKTDVKAQAKAKAEEVKGKVNEFAGKAREVTPDQAVEVAQRNPLPIAAGGAFVVGFLLGRRRGRRSAE